MERNPYEVAENAYRFATAGIVLSIFGGIGVFLSLQAQVLALELTAANDEDKRYIRQIKQRGRIGVYIATAWLIILILIYIFAFIIFIISFVIADTTPVPTDSSIINPWYNQGVDVQNQNATYAQPQGTGGLQSQSATIPETFSNSPNQATDYGLFGGTSDTASLLNQTQVLGTSSTPSAAYTPAQQPGSGILVYLLIAAAALAALGILIWRKSLLRVFREIEDSEELD